MISFFSFLDVFLHFHDIMIIITYFFLCLHPSTNMYVPFLYISRPCIMLFMYIENIVLHLRSITIRLLHPSNFLHFDQTRFVITLLKFVSDDSGSAIFLHLYCTIHSQDRYIYAINAVNSHGIARSFIRYVNFQVS